MRPNRSAAVVYNFSFETDSGKKVLVKFYNKKNFFCGADHAAPYNLRRSWAQTLFEQPNWTWTPLEQHPYINFLKNNDFIYKESLLIISENCIKIFVR